MQDVITVLDAVCDKLGVAIDWSAENVAPKLEAFVARYSTYLIAVHILYLVLALLVLAGGVTAMVLTWRSYRKRGWAYDGYLGGTSHGMPVGCDVQHYGCNPRRNLRRCYDIHADPAGHGAGDRGGERYFVHDGLT